MKKIVHRTHKAIFRTIGDIDPFDKADSIQSFKSGLLMLHGVCIRREMTADVVKQCEKRPTFRLDLGQVCLSRRESVCLAGTVTRVAGASTDLLIDITNCNSTFQASLPQANESGDYNL